MYECGKPKRYIPTVTLAGCPHLIVFLCQINLIVILFTTPRGCRMIRIALLLIVLTMSACSRNDGGSSGGSSEIQNEIRSLVEDNLEVVETGINELGDVAAELKENTL